MSSQFAVPTPTQLAQVLRGLRKTQKSTQADVASRGGLLPKTVSAIETHPANVTVESLYRLLSALDVELVVRTKGDRRAAEW